MLFIFEKEYKLFPNPYSQKSSYRFRHYLRDFKETTLRRKSKMPKIYTKTGDKGSTSLYHLGRLPKSDIVFDVLGDLDELSAHIGLLCALLGESEEEPKVMSDSKESEINSKGLKETSKNGDKILFLRRIQSTLLDIGSACVTKPEVRERYDVTDENIFNLELKIDHYEEKNAALTEFILVGVQEPDSVSHLCRSICRRAERNLWKKFPDGITKNIGIYLNRLSDFFFVFARYLSGGVETRRSEI